MPATGFGLEANQGGLVAVVWIILVAAFWALVLLGLVLGIRWLLRAERDSHRDRPAPPPPPGPGELWAGHGTAPRAEDPLEVLRMRYARGEIDDDEFERRRAALTSR
jgi:uncharacterized membrane protein